jgi:hypothetical protein
MRAGFQGSVMRRFGIIAVFLFLSQPLEADDGFVPLFSGTLNGWTIENTRHDNFTVDDGVLRVEGPEGWLRSDKRYSDFTLRVEFRFLTEDADSGIFLRTDAASQFFHGWPDNSYQVQMRNPMGQSPFPPIGGIFRHGAPPGETVFDPEDAARLFTGTFEWQVLEIELAGDALKVRLNGGELARASNIVNPEGFIGIQGESGIVEFRKIEIREE